MAQKTKEQASSMIDALRKQKEVLPEFNAFDENNHKFIEQQIEVCKNYVSTGIIEELDKMWEDDEDIESLENAEEEIIGWLEGRSEPPVDEEFLTDDIK